ncbi:MAG: DNA polymerase III subunit gamma/tau [Polyangia bacterium]
MSYLVLARKWRPQTFEDVVGQNHVTRTLANAIEMDRVAHAFLFSGVRGVGKTSLARILAKALNCEHGPTPRPCGECGSCRTIADGGAVDVIEIDGASNNSVDDIRELRETVPYRPALGRYKIYVIDEVHMLSASAFNALLKTLEEPPPHVKFIFATTEPHKIPATILSRCQRYDFRRISTPAVVERVRAILDSEEIEADEEALAIIGREAEGSMRDALSLLDQVLAAGTGKLSGTAVSELLGVVTRRVHYDVSAALLAGDPRRCLEIVRDVDRQGFESISFTRGLLEHLRNLVVAGVCGSEPGLLDLPEEEIAELAELAGRVSNATLHRLFKHFAEAYEEIARSDHPRLLLETTLARLAEMGDLLPAAELVGRLEALAGKPGASPGRGSGGGGGSGGGTRSAGSANERGGRNAGEPPKVRADGGGAADRAPRQASPALRAALEIGSLREALAAFARENPAIASVVERAEPSVDGDDLLRLRFDRDDAFAVSVASDAARQRQITGYLERRLGRSVRLEVELGDLGGCSAAAREKLARQERLREIDTEARQHPLVRGVLDELGGKISRVRPQHIEEGERG